ncbi:MAG: T9SS type A sorting domain-containing protein [Bacteroidales bacterium]
MKKIFTFSLLIGLSVTLTGQTYLIEDFSGNQMPPSGWTIDGLPAQWSINAGNVAGGTPPEAKFTYINQTTLTRLVSPALDLSGLTSVKLTFRHFYDDYTGAGPLAGVATRSGGGNWNSVWEINPTSNVGPEELTFEISNSNVGQADFQFCFYLNGNMYNVDYWYIDDIWLYNPLNLDAGITEITTPTYLGEPTEVTGTIKNFGLSLISSLQINWQVDSGDIYVSEFTGLSLNFGEVYNFASPDLFNMPIGTYTLKVWITGVNGVLDEDPSNDLKEKTIHVVSHVVGHKPCLEEFTSSTCAPCASFNTSFVPWCISNADQITLVKYQMNWPGTGDPYYTAEGGVRRNWYGVSWVPWTNLDGTYTDNNMATINTMFSNSLAEPGLMKVVGSHSLTGTVMDIGVTVLPFAAFDNTVVHIVVFENITTGNVATNGETEFHHVMMKMVPDANGTTVNLADRVPFIIQETVNLAGTNVEEWDDLGVAIIVQHLESKYIWQSDYSAEDAVYNTDADLLNILADGEPIEGFSPSILEYTVTLPYGSVEVPEITVETSDPEALAIVVPANTLPGATTIDVFAENLSSHATYTVNFDISTGLGSESFEVLTIYPNPASDVMYISGAKGARGALYSITGSILIEFENFDTGKIDLTTIGNGVYFLKIMIDQKTTITKKVVVRK